MAAGETGNNSLAYSSDGITWTGLGKSIFAWNAYSVGWNGTRWVAAGWNGGGTTNSLAYSADGITWTGLGASIFTSSGYGVGWNGTRWVAGGGGATNSLAYSSDGITWTGLGKSIFDTTGYSVGWNGTRWVAVGRVTNSLAYSADGITWTGLGASIFSTTGYGVASAPAPNLYPAQPQMSVIGTNATIISTNLLSAESLRISSINSFVYNLSAKPSGTTATIQFSQDGATWKNSSGTVGGTDTLTTGANNSISLSSLSWSGANFYYKVVFGGDGTNTPVLDDSTVNYTAHSDCTSIPTSGNYTLAASCAFPGTINGVDAGSGTTNTALLTLGAGGSLTILSDQTVAVGSLSLSGGTVTIVDGGSIKIGTPLYLPDTDSDGYPTSVTTTQYTSAAAGRARRGAGIDYNDALNTVYPGTACNGNCSVNNADGTCTAKAAGENGLAACLRCDGSSLTAVNIATLNDAEGSNTSAGTCAAYCSSGSSINTDTAAGTCTVATNARVASGGTGHCTSGTCVVDFICGTSTVTWTYKGGSVTYGTVSSTGSRCWLDRNLGASQVAVSSTDTNAYGDLFQWGRLDDGHQTRTSGTTLTRSSSDNPGHSNFIGTNSSPFIDDWRSTANDNLWQGVSGINNPCPSGWRIPTATEWITESNTWSPSNMVGAFASPLKMTVAGFRIGGTQALHAVGGVGEYWSSNIQGTYTAKDLLFDNFVGDVMIQEYQARSDGRSVRCIKD